MDLDGCPCCTDPPRPAGAGGHVGQLLTGEPVVDDPLPAALREDLETFAGVSPVRTLDDWAAVVNRRTPGTHLSPEALCHTDEPTPHWADDGDDRHHFSCFFDGILYAALTGTAMTIRTESPAGTTIRAVSDGRTLTDIRPIDAVFSFGVDPTVSPDPSVRPAFEAAYRAHCPYIRAFPSIEAYQRWSATVAVPTVAIPLAGATSFVDALSG